METDLPITLEERKESCRPLVLVVDDDPMHHRLLKLIANRLQFTAHLVSSCDEAVSALKLFSFDVILMDYRMPEVDGCQCTRIIRDTKILDQVAIIAVTADVMPGCREKCLEAGMDDFLPKPFTLDELHEKLCFWLDKKIENQAGEDN